MIGSISFRSIHSLSKNSILLRPFLENGPSLLKEFEILLFVHGCQVFLYQVQPKRNENQIQNIIQR